jgi:3-dehydroquinate dehydratase-2
MRVLLLNGPNLNLLGTRRPEVYGSTTLPEVESMFAGWAQAAGVEAEAFQSNHEGALIDRIHAARGSIDGIVFNPGAYTHTSYALHDAIESVEIPTVEVHISNVEERESWRRFSAVRPACVHTIYGRGVDGYRWGLRHLVARDAWAVTTIRYGDHPDQFAELRLPESSHPGRLAVVVHGGFWRHMWTRDTTDLIAIDLARRGVASLNVEYRRVGAGGGGQVSIDDVVAAVSVATEGREIDPSGWAIVGHSAGGQLALLAARALGDEGRGPVLVATMGGVSDLQVAMDTNLGAGAAAAYVADAAPDSLSPTSLLPIGTPILAAHATSDDRVPIAQSERLVAAATAAGDRVTMLAIEDAGHFDHLEPTHTAWTTVAEEIVAALAD